MRSEENAKAWNFTKNNLYHKRFDYLQKIFLTNILEEATGKHIYSHINGRLIWISNRKICFQRDII